MTGLIQLILPGNLMVRIHYSMFDVGRSMFDVHWLLLRFDLTLAVSGGAHVKFHQSDLLA
jgi:hypothetical protein